MFKTNIIANKCFWLKTRPQFTLQFTEKKKRVPTRRFRRVKNEHEPSIKLKLIYD